MVLSLPEHFCCMVMIFSPSNQHGSVSCCNKWIWTETAKAVFHIQVHCECTVHDELQVMYYSCLVWLESYTGHFILYNLQAELSSKEPCCYARLSLATFPW